MKILSIGNSFSQDAHKWLKPVFESAGQDVLAVNLYIGGCSLETHWNNWLSGEAAYMLEVNAVYQRMISLQEALALESWDVITLQQASHFSGRPQTYVPFVGELAKRVREACPGAQLYLQQTWAYEADAAHPGFAVYGNNQREMYTRLQDAYEMASRLVDAPLIPVGDVIQHLREQSPVFDVAAGGCRLTRDGFHLHEPYGRYAAALTWFAVLTGGDVDRVSFFPPVEGADPCFAEPIKAAVKAIVNT